MKESMLEFLVGLVKRNQELVKELMLKSAELSETREELRRVKSSIEIHREQTGHNLCWLNDKKLWDETLGPSDIDHRSSLPPRSEFLEGCRSYYESRLRCLRDP